MSEVQKRPFYLYFHIIWTETWFGRNSTNRICDLNSCNDDIQLLLKDKLSKMRNTKTESKS